MWLLSLAAHDPTLGQQLGLSEACGFIRPSNLGGQERMRDCTPDRTAAHPQGDITAVEDQDQGKPLQEGKMVQQTDQDTSHGADDGLTLAFSYSQGTRPDGMNAASPSTLDAEGSASKDLLDPSDVLAQAGGVAPSSTFPSVLDSFSLDVPPGPFDSFSPLDSLDLADPLDDLAESLDDTTEASCHPFLSTPGAGGPCPDNDDGLERSQFLDDEGASVPDFFPSCKEALPGPDLNRESKEAGAATRVDGPVVSPQTSPEQRAAATTPSSTPTCAVDPALVPVIKSSSPTPALARDPDPIQTDMDEMGELLPASSTVQESKGGEEDP